MFNTLFVVLGLLKFTVGQTNNIGNSMKLTDANFYYARVMQETIHSLEEMGWSSFRMPDFNQTVNEITHTNYRVQGQVSYTNGFLVSIQKLHITNVQTQITSRTDAENNEIITQAFISGRLNLMDVAIGYDVAVSLTDDDEVHYYTGIFTHSSIVMTFNILRNMNTKENTISSTLTSLAGGTGVRMVFMPSDSLSQVLSLTFAPSVNWDGVVSWMTSMREAMLDVVDNKVAFPNHCFNC